MVPSYASRTACYHEHGFQGLFSTEYLPWLFVIKYWVSWAKDHVVSISFPTPDGCGNVVTSRSVNCGRTYRLVEDDQVESRESQAPGSFESQAEQQRIPLHDTVHLTEDILDGEVSDFRRVHLIGTTHSVVSDENDNEAGFLSSDDESDDEDQFSFWTPGAFHSREPLETIAYRASAHRPTSVSSID
jgi:hypothetical protein